MHWLWRLSLWKSIVAATEAALINPRAVRLFCGALERLPPTGL